MDALDIVNDSYNALYNYFTTLSIQGYKSYSSVERLLVLLFIEELITGPMAEFIDEEDYNVISESLYCLYGTCMIPFPSYKEGISKPVYKLPMESFRHDENSSYRVTESPIIRTVL